MDMSVQVQRCLYANPFESFRSNKQGFWGLFLAAAVSEENMRGLGTMEYGCSNSLYAQHQCVA
jgi:hypothetical protein